MATQRDGRLGGASGKDGGRGFGFTGGHFHWNWGNDQFRKLMLNAITVGRPRRWRCPKGGVSEQAARRVEELEANQDEQPPGKLQPRARSRGCWTIGARKTSDRPGATRWQQTGFP